ncbi:MOSC domain-containing protein [Paenibacillus sp. Soil724D2]|uniref:MOSC domain-containing protein n=1 Tax=Paenibacillus sp. (strain Soil724D2) TaxID=1736392 RepID=UPI0007131640|nr:MOSC N-terminal beta barrel domain-containing protein [Paenibacillus sp. Soil724D2]KRE44304.1 sulfurase [Paenibacillus sp. Soil724D2]
MTLLVGQISEINRYPVKSFAGESLETCTINTYGLYGDRFCAFIDETKDGWDSFITARDIPNMLTYKAKLVDKGVSVTSPNGITFSWNEELLDEIQRYSKRKISMTNYKAPNPENPDLMSVDLASVLIITDSSLRKLEAIWGKNIDKQRFRANLIVSIDENTFNENDWIGKQISVGDAVLQIESYCQRCSIITIDPDTLIRDTSLLKKVNEQMNLCFGVYASVKNPGQIHVGQKVYLSD